MHGIKGQRWLPLAVLAGITLCWLPALAGPFQFDDHNIIVNFAPVHSLGAWWQSMPGIRPLLKLSYAINWVMSPSPSGFHLFNLLLHLGNGVLLLAWARRVLPLREGMALVLVTLWLLHPVQTEAVTYIAGRSVSLSANFLLCGLLVLACAPNGARWWAALFTLLGLAVRETAWVFPLVFVLVEFMRGKRWREAVSVALPAIVVVVLAAGYFLWEPHHRHLLEVSVATRDMGAQLRAQTGGLLYLSGQLFSLTPNIDPDLPVPAQWSAVLLLQAAAILSALCLSAYLVWRHRSWTAAGVLWFFLLLLPTNSLLPRLDVANDRHLYLALLGPLWVLVRWLQEWRIRRAVLAALVVLLAVATLIRNEDYRSELALWARTVQQSPQKARAWNNLGMACRDAGRSECAEQSFRQAMALDPDDTTPAVNLYFLSRPAPGRGQ